MHITSGLLDALLSMAADADPQSVTIRLAVTDAAELDVDDEIDPDTPVFSDLYFPGSGDSVEAVFGVDVSIPPGQTPGVFNSHPHGDPTLNTADTFAERVLVAIPPWSRDDVAAYDRGGRQHDLTIVTIHDGETAG